MNGFFKKLAALTLFLVALAAPARLLAVGGTYAGDEIADHGHSAPGDGGLLTTLSLPDNIHSSGTVSGSSVTAANRLMGKTLTVTDTITCTTCTATIGTAILGDVTISTLSALVVDSSMTFTGGLNDALFIGASGYRFYYGSGVMDIWGVGEGNPALRFNATGGSSQGTLQLGTGWDFDAPNTSPGTRFGRSVGTAGWYVMTSSSMGNQYEYLAFDNGTVVGSVTRNGSTGVTYNTTSDRRLKENIRETTAGLGVLMKIRVRDFNFKKEPARRVQGFIAQELYEVYPTAVTVGGKSINSHPWGVDYGRLTPLLVRTVQEQQRTIEALTARVLALEAGR